MTKRSLEFRVWGLKFPFAIGRISVAIGFLLFIALTSTAQKVSSSVSKSTIRIGEQFELKLTAEPSANNTLLIDKWFSLADTFNHFEVVQRLPIDTLEVSGTKSFEQKIILTSFDTGSYDIPALNLVMVDNKSLSTEALQINILPVDISNLKDYHDIKEIIEPEPETDWILIVEIAAGVILLIVLIVFLAKYLSRKKPIKPLKKKLFTIDDIIKEIEGLQPLIAANKHKQLFTQLVIITRNFSDAQLNLSTLTKTTDEYMVVLKGKVGNEPTQVQFFQLLRLADAVKFAKFHPSESECLQGLQHAKTFVKTIHSFNYQPKANAV